MWAWHGMIWKAWHSYKLTSNKDHICHNHIRQCQKSNQVSSGREHHKYAKTNTPHNFLNVQVRKSFEKVSTRENFTDLLGKRTFCHLLLQLCHEKGFRVQTTNIHGITHPQSMVQCLSSKENFYQTIQYNVVHLKILIQT